MAVSKYSKEVQDAICASLEEGNGQLDSARAGGIHPATYFEWLDKDSPYYNSDFSDAVKKARALGDHRIREQGLAAIKKAGDGYTIDGENIRPQWQPWAWILERRFPDEFGRRERIDGKHEVDLTIKIVGDDTGGDDNE